MRLKDARDSYYYNSAKAGDVGRQLALGGIAVAWLLHGGAVSLTFPTFLLTALAGFLGFLISDFLQCFVVTIIWGSFSYKKEKGFKKLRIDPSKESDRRGLFKAPVSINWAAIFFFYLKAMLLIIGVIFLAIFIAHKVSWV